MIVSQPWPHEPETISLDNSLSEKLYVIQSV